MMDYLALPFVQRALVAGMLVALCASLLGVPLVLRRLSFIGDGLSHVAFGAMAVAGALSFAGNLPLSLAATILCAILLLRRGPGGDRVRGDAALAMLSAGAMAIGYLLMNLFPSASKNTSGDVCSTLFGSASILTLTPGETWACAGLALAVLVYHLFAYHRTFELAFDDEYARASGTRSGLADTLSAAVIAVVIVISMRFVGALLVSALLVFPAVSAMRICKSYRAVTLAAALLGTLGALAGMLVSILAPEPQPPVGPTIVALNLLLFAVCSFTARFFS